MSSTITLALGIALWLAAPVAVFFGQRRGPHGGAGLSVAYLVQAGVVYWPGALAAALPWSWYRNLELVGPGFALSALGAAAFSLGAGLAAPAIARARAARRPPEPPAEPAGRSLAPAYAALGLLCITVLTPRLLAVPTVGALAAAANNFLLVGLMLGAWGRLRAGRSPLPWLIAAGTLPLLTVALFGFLGLGFVALAAVLTFVLSQTRVRWPAVILLALGLYVGLSGFVTYMRDRSAIRQLTAADAALAARAAQVSDTLGGFEWFDPWNQRHLSQLDDRLNQSYLVGAAAALIREGYQGFAGGRTIADAFLSLVPRALWPEKPLVAGGSALVSAFTGLSFAEGTSVGMGQVMEFYVNFGAAGVAAGFFLYGLLLGLADDAAMRRLRRGDERGFALWAMAGLAALSSTNALFEISSSVGAALAAAWAVGAALSVLAPREGAAGPAPGAWWAR